MHLSRLRVQNFRGLEDIDVAFESAVSVIIGPNAIGKTTVLEAIRIAKALLAPRTQNEGSQVLNSLGATSPHMPQRLFPKALTNRPGIPLSIKCSFDLEENELKSIFDSLKQLASAHALQSSGLNIGNPAQAASFFSSPQGKSLLVGAEAQLRDEFSRVSQTKKADLNLVVNFMNSSIAGEFPLQQLFVAHLDQSLAPNGTKFSYFPADRALPTGEQPVQLGLADINQQLESYNSQPQLKYSRLKHTIFSSIISGDEGRKRINEQFARIFADILKGRSLGEVGVNESGMLSVPIVDTETQNTFEIDSLSSGEKGLILSFLTIANSMCRDGILLLDEPELHLNPAVCRDLLQFIIEEYALKMNVQAIICSHSAEILAGALDHTSCSLFHLRSGTSLAKVRYHDQGEIRDALRRLGSSESEALLYRGTVSVEGIHDVETLSSGFDQTLRRYRLRQRGGRGQVEKDIQELQKAESSGEEIGYHFFVFDHDRRPTSLVESKYVKFLQWERVCLENYLLDEEILTDLSRDQDLSNRPQTNTTDMRKALETLALQQIGEFAARRAFRHMGLESVCFDMEALKADGPQAVAATLQHQIGLIQARLSSFRPNFLEEFQILYNKFSIEEQQAWRQNWKNLCDGKKLFNALRRDNYFKGDLQRLKRRIIIEMRNRRTEIWHSLDGQLASLIRP